MSNDSFRPAGPGYRYNLELRGIDKLINGLTIEVNSIFMVVYSIRTDRLSDAYDDDGDHCMLELRARDFGSFDCNHKAIYQWC